MGDIASGMGIIGVLMLILLMGMPIAFSLLTSGIIGLIWVRGWVPTEFTVSTFFYSYVSNLSFVVLPLFLLMGNLAFSAGLSDKAFRACRTFLGNVPGGLATGVVFGCAAFATVCGSSVATAVTMGRVAIPEMLKTGYRPWLASGCVAAGGTLGVLIPPSGVLVIYSIATQVSIIDLFIAAFTPGVLTAVIYAVLIGVLVRFKPDLAPIPPKQRISLVERLRALVSAWEILLLFLIVMGSIYFGIATATEAAAFGAAGALVILIWRKGESSFVSTFRPAFIDAASTTASVFALVIGAGLFSVALATTHVATMLADYVVAFDLPPTLLVLCMLIPFIVLGCFVDGISLILLTMPIAFPIVETIGFHPVLFGLVVTKAVEIGAITPPVGLNVFAVKGVAPEVPLSQVFLGCVPFILVEVFIVVLLLVFPEISLWLLE